MNIHDRIIAALSPLGLGVGHLVYKVGTGETMPASYLVYSIVTNLPEQHADNVENLTTYRIQVTAWTTAPVKNLPDIKGAMVSTGFTWATTRDLAYEMDTKRSGVAMDFYYTEDAL